MRRIRTREDAKTLRNAAIDSDDVMRASLIMTCDPILAANPQCIARNMVTRWGLSEKLGPLTYSDDEGEVFLGKSVTQQKLVSDETAHLIDEEVRDLVDRNYTRAKDILEANLEKLHVMAKALIKYETLDVDQIDEIMNGEDPSPPKDWSDDNSDNDKDGSSLSEEETNGKIGGPASLH